MTKIEGKKEWSDVLLLEDGDVLHGGDDGLINVQAKALVDRTEYLKEELLEVKEQTAGLGPNMGGGGEGGGGNLPAGTIIAFGGTKVPFGYLECNGALLIRTTYVGLFDAIGTTWGFTSDNNFKIPNFAEAEQFLRSRSDTLPVGALSQVSLRNGTTGEFLIFDSAVVMYCIKVLDSVIDPEQILASSVLSEIANKADRNEIKELAGTRLWVSGEYTPILNKPTIVNHLLMNTSVDTGGIMFVEPIDPLKCRCDVLVKCVKAEGGYSVGEYLISPWVYQGVNLCAPLTPNLNDRSIQINTGGTNAGFYGAVKTTGGYFALTLANWRYIFRIWY